MIAYRSRYKLGSMSFLSRKKHIQFDKKDNRVYNITKLMHCQKIIFTKTRFQIESFY